MDKYFSKEDRQKVVDFLNFIATRATFVDWKTEDTITHFGHLSFMQRVLLPKIDANICEVEAVVKDKEVEEAKE